MTKRESRSDQAFAGRVRQAAERVGGRVALATKAGMSARSLDDYLAGKAEPKLSRLLAISTASGVSLKWLATGEGPIEPTTSDDASLAKFVLVPRYDVSASAGPGALISSEHVKDRLAFQEMWFRTTLRVDPARCGLIDVVGDSMEPTLRTGDVVLVDFSVDRLRDDSIYVIEMEGEVQVKRLQRLLGGAVIRSDNPAYQPITLDKDQVEQLRVIGRVRWFGRTI